MKQTLSLFFAFLVACECRAQSATAEAPPWHRLVGILQYLEADYPGAVESASAFELEEQRSFAAEALETAQALGPQAAPFFSRLEAVQAQVRAGKNPKEVSAACHSLVEELVVAGGISRSPRTPPDLKRGEVVFGEACAACHGMDGKAQGDVPSTLNPRPKSFQDAAVMGKLSPYKAFNTTSFGVTGTAMPGFPTLSDSDRWNAVFFLFSLRQPECKAGLPPGATLEWASTSTDDELAARFGENALPCLRRTPPATKFPDALAVASSRVKDAIAKSKTADFAGAKVALLDAYLQGLEPVEPLLRSRDPDRVQRLEEAFLQARVFADAKDSRVVTASETVLSLLEEANQSERRADAVSVFLQALLILVREGFEAVIVIVALLAVLKKMNATSSARVVHAGWMLAAVVGALVFLFARAALAGANREWMEGLVALAAVGMLLYAALWLNARANTRKFMGKLRADMQDALGSGSTVGLFFISFSALLRESLETALFLQGLAIDSPKGVAWGAVAGLALLFGLVAFVKKVGFVLPMKQLFTASTVLLYATAVMLLGKGLHALAEVGALPVRPIPFVRIDTLGVFPDALSLGAQFLLAIAPLIYVRVRRTRETMPQAG